MTDQETKLKPCPFCGHPGDIRGLVWSWWVECRDADCVIMPETTHYDTKADAIAAWNTRKGEAKWREMSDHAQETFMSKPIITDVRYLVSKEFRGCLEINQYVVETDILWDANTTITICRETVARNDNDEATKKRIYEAMRNSSERLAISLLDVDGGDDRESGCAK